MPKIEDRKERSLGLDKENDHFSSTEEHNDLLQLIENLILSGSKGDLPGLTFEDLVWKCHTTRGKIGETLGRLKAKGKIKKNYKTGCYVPSC